MDKREKAYLRNSKKALNNHFTYILDNVKKIEKKLNKQQEKMTDLLKGKCCLMNIIKQKKHIGCGIND